MAIPEHVSTAPTGGDVPESTCLGGGGSPGEPDADTLEQGVTAPLQGCRRCRGEGGDGDPPWCTCVDDGVGSGGGRGGGCKEGGGGEGGDTQSVTEY